MNSNFKTRMVALATLILVMFGWRANAFPPPPPCYWPTITTPPSSRTVCADAATTFSVVATGTGLTFQWQVKANGSAIWTDIPGATGASYPIPATASADNGNQYQVKVSGSCGPTVTSTPAATLTVNTSPTITTPPSGQTVCAGAPAIFSVIATGAGLTFQWQVKANGSFTWVNVTGGTTSSTATSSTYTTPATGSADNAKQYRVVVSGSCPSAVESSPVTLTINQTITLQPISQTVTYGNPATFSVSATGTGLTYQWRRNGVNINGATTSSYTETKPPVSYSGSYYDVVVRSTACSAAVVSSRATLTVNPAVLTLKANDASRQYGSPNPSFSYTIVGGFVSGDTASVLQGEPSFSTTATLTSPVSGPTYPIRVIQSYLSAVNYTFVFQDGQLTITPANLTVTANNKSRFYGDPNPSPLDGVISGLKNNDNITASYSTTAGPTSVPNDYPITPAWNASPLLVNYTATIVPGVLTVEPLKIVISQTPMEYQLGRPPMPVDSNAQLASSGLANLNGYQLVAGFDVSQDKDKLSIRNYGDGLDEIGVTAAGTVTIGDDANLATAPIPIATVTGGVPPQPLVVSFNANATPGRVQALLRNVAYGNTSSSPLESQRKMRMVIKDSTAKDACKSVTRDINVGCPTGVDVMLIVDTTGSMVDPPPNGKNPDVPNPPGANITRLAAAKNAATYFLDYPDFQYDRVGVLSFYGIPPTSSNPTRLTPGTTLTLTSLARVGATTTARATKTGHGFTSGASVTISGASLSQFNGTFIIQNVTSSTFDYVMASVPSGNPTGTISARNNDSYFRTVKSDLANVIANINNTGGYTIYHPSLDTALVDLAAFANSPGRVPVVIFLTDGELYCGCGDTGLENYRKSAIASSRMLRNAGVRLMTVGLGGDVVYNPSAPTVGQAARDLLLEMASSADDCLIAPNQAALRNKYAEVAGGVCRNRIRYSIPSLTYTENNPATVMDPNFDFNDPAGVNYLNDVLTISLSPGSPEDWLNIRGQSPLTVVGNSVQYNGTTIGTVAGLNTPTLTVTFNGSANLTSVRAVLQNITYFNNSDNPSTATRLATATITDGVNYTSPATTMWVNVIPVNDAPVISFLAATLDYTENENAKPVDQTLTLGDVDSANFDGGYLEVSITGNGQPSDVLSIASSGSIVVSGQTVSYSGNQIATFTGGNGVTPLRFTLNASATVPATLALARNLIYRNTSDNPLSLTRTVSALLNDGDGGTSTPTDIYIHVVPVNDPPIAVNDSYSVNSTRTLSVPGPGVLENDSDIEGDTLAASSVVTGPTKGTITLNADGSFTYQQTPLTSGTDTFTYLATDNGTTDGEPDPKSDVATVTLTLNAVDCQIAQVSSLSLSPNSTTGGDEVTGTVTLTAPTTLQGGQLIDLVSNSENALPPVSVLVPNGAQSATFRVKTRQVSADTTIQISASYSGGASQSANLTVHASLPGEGLPIDAPNGFLYSVFADGLSAGRVGPVGMAKTASGMVMVTIPWIGKLVILPDTDGQHFDPSVNPPIDNGVGIYGLAKLESKIYGADNLGQSIVELSDDGTIIRQVYIGKGVLGLAANPRNGLLYATAGSEVLEIDPNSGNFSIFAEVPDSDGVVVSPDGETLFVANYFGRAILGFDIASGATVLDLPVWPPGGGNPDGLAIGQGSLANKLFVNCTGGELVVVDLETETWSTFSASQGGRGDFVLVDDDGSLLLTQTDRILRLTPPAGGSFGTVSGTICTRDDQATTYAPISLGTVAESFSTEAGVFDLRGIAGDVYSAYFTRAGRIIYSAANGFHLEYGIAPFDPLSDNPLTENCYASKQSLTAGSGVIKDYSATWLYSPAYLEDLQLHLASSYSVKLADRLSSGCGTITLTDTPQANWPQAKNTLTFLAKSIANPRIPVGTCLDIALFDAIAPANGDWEIVLKNRLVASSGNPRGWNVELDQTPYRGAFISVPLTAEIATSYEVRVAGSPAKSSRFDVVPAASVLRAPVLQPISLSPNPVAPGSSVAVKITLDRPAPLGGATVSLSSDNASFPVQNAVFIPAGTLNQTFNVTVAADASAGLANVTASYNGVRQSTLRIKTGTGSPPSPPVITATEAAGSVTLNWTSVGGVAYNVKRSRNHSGPYTTIFSGLKSSPYVDTDVINGLAYYYVVSAENDFGEGANSAEVSATPTIGTVATPTASPLPSGPESSPISVTLSDATTRAIIRYTLDGSEPTEASPVYKTPIVLSVTTTLKAKAFKNGYRPSAVAQYTYTINYTPPLTQVDCGGIQSFTFNDSWTQRSMQKGQAHHANHFSLDTASLATPLAAGDKLIITLSSADLDGYLYLASDSSIQTILAQNNDATSGTVNSRIEYTIPAGGPAAFYYIEATTSHPGETGECKLYVNTVDASTGNHCPAGLSVLMQKFDGTVDPVTHNSTLNVGPGYIGVPGIAVLILANTSGTLGLDVTSVVVSGDFVGSAVNLPVISAGESMSLPIRLTSTSLGNGKTGTITIIHNGASSPFVVNLTANVVDPATAPTVTLDTPTAGPIVDSSVIQLAATATAINASISKVEFMVTPQGQPTAKLGEANTSPYVFNWIGATPGTYTLAAKAWDSNGRSQTSAGVTITVSAPSLSGAPTIIPSGGTYSGSVRVRIDRNAGWPAEAVTVYTTEPGNSAQWYLYQEELFFTHYDFPSGFTLRARGYKPGVQGPIASAAFTINPGPVVLPPVVNIHFPSDGEEITEPVTVTGTAMQAAPGTFKSWKLEHRLHRETGPFEPWVVFASGTAEVIPAGGEPAADFDASQKFDPTVLLNGLYDIRLSAANNEGDVATVVNTVEVKGKQKIGNFTLSFTDLTIPVAGVPVQVVRTYDSRDKGQGDFGIGWRLGINNVRVQKSGVIGSGWNQVRSGGVWSSFAIDATSPHRLTITMPGDEVYSFEAEVSPAYSLFYPIEVGKVIYRPMRGTPGNLTLTPVHGSDFFVDVTQGPLDLLNEDMVTPYDESEFDLRLKDGKILRLVVDQGLKSITDLNGEVFEFELDGVWKRSNLNSLPREKFVSIVREGTAGGALNRITQVFATKDSTKKVLYSYGVTGAADARDLIGVTDQELHTTQFKYDDRHNLFDIIDAKGVRAVRTTYDADGRVIEVIDALGNKTTTTYNLSGKTVATTDALNHQSEISYDSYGNIIRNWKHTGPSANDGIEETFEFNDPANPDKPTKRTDALGRTSYMVYSASGDLISLTDPLGHVTRTDYNDFGKPTLITDALGRVVLRNEYDSAGRLILTTDAMGASTQNDFNDDGTLSKTTDAKGRSTKYFYNDAGADPAGTLLPTRVEDALGHTTFFVYDNSGNRLETRTSRTLPDGSTEQRISIPVYDKTGKITSESIQTQVGVQQIQYHPKGSTIYDENGNAQFTKNENGQETEYKYDLAGRLIETISPDNKIAKTTYDALGRVATTTDQAQRTTRYEYDVLGRLARTFSHDGSVTTSTFDNEGQLIDETDSLGQTAHFEYDDAGRRIKSKDALGNVTTYEYNEIGQTVAVTDANANKTFFEYDAAGRLVKTIFPDQTTRHVEYDTVGQKISETDQASVKTLYSYDERGRLKSVTIASGTSVEATTDYEYYEDGNLKRQIDANLQETTFEYDYKGRRTKRTLPGNQFETTEYALIPASGLPDEKVLQVTHTDFNALKTITTYDRLGRLFTKAVEDGGAPITKLQYSYSPTTGQMDTMADMSGTTTYHYDHNGRLESKHRAFTSSLNPNLAINHSYSLNYTYDVRGRVKSISSLHQGGELGVSMTYSYDVLGRVSEVQDSNGKVTKYGYDKVGNLSDVTYPTDTPVKTAYTYNSLNRLLSMTANKLTAGAPQVAAFDYNPIYNPNAPVAFDLDRTLGPTGNRRGVREFIAGAGAIAAVNRAVNYDYDEQYRLTKEDIKPGLTGPSGTLSYLSGGGGALGYDRVGNRRSRVVNLSTAIPGLTTINNSFDLNDRFTGTGYQYDNNGNAQVEPLPTISESPSLPVVPTTAHPDQYDYENHLTRRTDGAATISILYDGKGNRVHKKVTGLGGNNEETIYVIDDRNPTGYAQVLEELTPDGSGGWKIARRYNYGHSLISQDIKSGNIWSTSYYGYDGHNNVRFLLNTAGTTTDTYTYDAFGVVLNHDGSTANNYLYSGQQYDPHLGTYYLRARYLNPNTGRFWSMDSFEGNTGDPLSLHKYLYVNGNVPNRVDFSGREGTEVQPVKRSVEVWISYTGDPILAVSDAYAWDLHSTLLEGGGDHDFIVISVSPLENIFNRVKTVLEREGIVAGRDKITRVYISGHGGNGGRVGAFGGNESDAAPQGDKDITDLSYERLQAAKSPQRQLFDYLRPLTEGGVVELKACEVAADDAGKQTMQLMANLLNANVVGYDDWCAVKQYGNQYTATPGEKEPKLTLEGKRWYGTWSWWFWTKILRRPGPTH